MATPDRGELLRLARELPDEQVPGAIRDVRLRLARATNPNWPPAFFGSAHGDGSAIGARSEELLSEGFGR